jgi:hypothetical protein
VSPRARELVTPNVVILAIAFVAYAWLHVRAGYSLPVPWPDEAHFLWPARSLAQHGTLVAPELHPDRALQWMPPGYAAVMAALYEVTGPSLAVARHVSAACTIAAAMLLAMLPRARIVGAIAAALWLFNPSVIAMGNVARMEAPMLALVLAGFVALDRDRGPLALAAFAAASALHPNGLVFAIAALAWIVATRTRVRPRDTPERSVLGLGVLACAVAWIMTITGDGFTDDLRFQLARKVDRDLLSPWLDRRTLVAIATAGTLVIAEHRRTRALLFAAALAALVARNVGREMWYAAFDPLFYALAAFALLDIMQRIERRIAIVVALALVAWPERPSVHFRGMTLRDDPYVSAETRDHIADALQDRGAIEVLPRGDAALFLEHDELHFVDPVRHAFEPDATLLHVSDHQPRHVQAEVRERIGDALPIADGWWLILAP